tara:strand:- start:1945 stop:2355 length:411 start_codon:yes stop_codon:yes gene_type:complete
MPAFHVQIQGSPVECRTPLLRRCFAIHSALLSTTTDGKPDPAEFGAVWSAALGACLPESVGAPRARGLQTPADWVEYGDRVERWAFGRGGQGYDIVSWQAASEKAWEAVAEMLPVPDTVEEAAAPFDSPVADGSDD